MLERFHARPDDAPDDGAEPAPRFADGTVTRVAQQKRDPERASVFVDGAFAFGLALDLAVEAGLRRGVFLSAEAQEALVEKERARKARAAALDYLSYQARTEAEVRRKLQQKGFDDAAVEDALAYVGAHGYLDDEAYARAYTRGRFTGRGYGPERLRQELLRRGVARETVEAVLAELAEAENLLEGALRHGGPKWRGLASEPDPRKRRQKTMEFLLRRGFSFDLARQAVERLAADDEASGEAEEATWEEG